MKGWLAVALLALGCYGAFAWAVQGAGARSPVPVSSLVPWLGLLAVPSLVALVVAARIARGQPARPGMALLVIFAVGVIIRVAFLACPPQLSDDIYRYLWDGRVQHAGLSPYGWPPDSPYLDGVEQAWPVAERVRSLVNHPEVPTVYPPLLELLFSGVAAAGGGAGAWRALLLVIDLAIALVLVRMLRVAARDPCWVVLYLWHPLPVLETCWSGHAEAVAVLGLVAGVHALQLSRGRWAAVLVGLGAAAKLLPIGIVPFLLRRAGLRSIGWLALALVAPTVPFWGVDLEAATRGLRAYASGWYFNDLLYRPLGNLLGLDPENQSQTSTAVLRGVFQVSWVGIAVLACWRVRSPIRAALWITMGFVLLTPTLHPWYLLWVLPFAIAEASLAAYVLTITVLASYVVLAGWQQSGVWIELPWVRWLEALPAVGVLVWQWTRGRQDSLSSVQARC